MNDSLENHLTQLGFSHFHHLSLLRTWMRKSLLVTCKSVLQYYLLVNKNCLDPKNPYEINENLKVDLSKIISKHQVNEYRSRIHQEDEMSVLSFR